MQLWHLRWGDGMQPMTMGVSTTNEQAQVVNYPSLLVMTMD